MNLRELNGSGKSLWVFFTTAIIALLTTGTFWWLLKEFNNYSRWRNAGHGDREQFSTIGPRIGMLVCMQSQGYTDWLWKHGFWWRVLINSESGLTSPIIGNGLDAYGLNAWKIASKFGPHSKFGRQYLFGYSDIACAWD